MDNAHFIQFQNLFNTATEWCLEPLNVFSWLLIRTKCMMGLCHGHH